MPKISVLIPVYGVEKYIEKFSKSLLNNTLASECEFIFVDDKSPDKSMEILKRIISNYPNLDIKIITHECNKGLSAARNTGFKNAKGEYLLFLDSDDWVESDLIEELYTCAVTNNADISICDFYWESDLGIKEVPQVISKGDDVYKKLIHDDIRSYLWCKLFKRSLFTSCNFTFNEDIIMLEDFYLCSRIFLEAKKICSVNKPLYHYRTNNSESISNSRGLLNIKETMLLYKNIQEFLKVNNIYELYCNELYYRILKVKIDFIEKNHFSIFSANKIFTKYDYDFMQKHVDLFCKRQQFICFWLRKRMFLLSNFICFLIDCKWKKKRINFDYSSVDISFFKYCNE